MFTYRKEITPFMQRKKVQYFCIKPLLFLCVNTYFDTICVHPTKSAYTLSKMRTVQLTDKLELAYFFFVGAISNTAVTIAYKPYNTQVIVLFQGKLISGWFNANTTNTMAITTITRPIILEIFLFIQSHSFVKFLFIVQFIIAHCNLKSRRQPCISSIPKELYIINTQCCISSNRRKIHSYE